VKDLNIPNVLALVAMPIIVSHKDLVRSKGFLASFWRIAKSFLVSLIPAQPADCLRLHGVEN